MESEVNLSDQIFCMDCMDLFPQIPDDVGYCLTRIDNRRLHYVSRFKN